LTGRVARYCGEVPQPGQADLDAIVASMFIAA